MSTYRELYAEGRRRLRTAGIDNADGDARELLLHVTGMSLNELLLAYDMEPDVSDRRKKEPKGDTSDDTAQGHLTGFQSTGGADSGTCGDITGSYLHMIDRRCSHVPLQYITHVQSFCGLDMYVDERVLIPRQDTEVLVERVLDIYGRRETGAREYAARGAHAGEHGSGLGLLDLCTGSGCIATALACLGSFDKVYASDISADALEVARRNAAAHEADIIFAESDMFDAIGAGHIGYTAAGRKEPLPERFDVIVSNPPYIPAAQVDMLDEEVRGHEPRLALEGREDGLYYYRRIAREAGRYLNDGGRLFLEIGCDQGAAVRGLLEAVGSGGGFLCEHGKISDKMSDKMVDAPEGAAERTDSASAGAARGYFDNVEITKDLAGLDRVVSAIWRRTDA